MENFSKADFSFMHNKLNILEVQVERIKAYIDQKFDEIVGVMDDLESRINNLR
ncbi:MAG: hypothetical protein LBI61_01940 [Puniceicoccales bacterium]|nr:hypothetical protein [Puniceicoccales bacterium]